MEVKEKCSCGAYFWATGEESTRLYKAWIRRHSCPASTSEYREVDISSAIGFTADYSGTGLDLPAKKYDPWEDE